MTLAGELVLSRNQLNESVAQSDQRGIRCGSPTRESGHFGVAGSGHLDSHAAGGQLVRQVPPSGPRPDPRTRQRRPARSGWDEVEIDKTILEGLSDPLTHMVRNAVDHGIEEPARRAAAGKPAAGTIQLKASHQAGQVVIEIADDGRGLDAAKIAASSLAKGAGDPGTASRHDGPRQDGADLPAGRLHRREGHRHLGSRSRHGCGQDQSRQARRQDRNRFHRRDAAPGSASSCR